VIIDLIVWKLINSFLKRKVLEYLRLLSQVNN